jgi:hypothetical protein
MFPESTEFRRQVLVSGLILFILLIAVAALA